MHIKGVEHTNENPRGRLQGQDQITTISIQLPGGNRGCSPEIQGLSKENDLQKVFDDIGKTLTVT